MTNHSYFNLNGDPTKPINNHTLYINADNYTPVDSSYMPTGEIASVEGLVFDCRKEAEIGERITNNDAAHQQVKFGNGFDHNFVIDGYDGTLREVAKACYDGRVMTVLSDLPGIQFYAGNMISPLKGKNGVTYGKRTAFCLETQFYPNSINQEGFAKPVIEANKPYKTTTIYQFG